eukprot:g21474.t1
MYLSRPIVSPRAEHVLSSGKKDRKKSLQSWWTLGLQLQILPNRVQFGKEAKIKKRRSIMILLSEKMGSPKEKRNGGVKWLGAVALAAFLSSLWIMLRQKKIHGQADEVLQPDGVMSQYMTQRLDRAVLRFLRRIHVVGYSVLGTQLGEGGAVKRAGDAPGPRHTIVDPAGLPYVSGKLSPQQAGAASKSIYSYLGLKDAFPPEVKTAITSPCDAKYHCYQGEKHCVHVVGPDFNQPPFLGMSVADAARSLGQAYQHVLQQAVLSPAPLLRLLPISGGVFAGAFRSAIAPLTFAALANGFLQVPDSVRARLDKLERVELCVFLAAELEAFQKAHHDILASQPDSSL